MNPTDTPRVVVIGEPGVRDLLATIRRRARAMSRQTGAPVAECARWLEEAGGDPALAMEMMRRAAR